MPPTKSEETIAPSILDALRKLVERWTGAKARERANYQLYLGELCAALEVEGPRPAGSGYEYEFPIKVVDREGKEGSNFVDLFKRDHFVLEAKDKEVGRTDELMLRKAYGQARSYVTHLPGTTPPYLLILDVAKTMMVWDRWEGGFGGFGAGRRIDLPSLHERTPDIALLRDIWARPQVRDPRARAQAITEKIAVKLAASLEKRGYDQERASRFLIRCVFTMFAEDVKLLHDEPFLRMIKYQIPRFGKQTQTEIISSESDDGSAVAGAAPATRVPWPSDAIGQITAFSALAATRAIGVEEVMSHFTGARRDLATRHLETLAILGELHLVGEGLYAAPPAVT